MEAQRGKHGLNGISLAVKSALLEVCELCNQDKLCLPFFFIAIKDFGVEEYSKAYELTRACVQFQELLMAVGHSES